MKISYVISPFLSCYCFHCCYLMKSEACYFACWIQWDALAYGSWYNRCFVQLHTPKFMKFQDLKKLSVPWCTPKVLIGMAVYVLECICFLSNYGYISSISMFGTVLLMYEVQALLFFTKRLSSKAAQNMKTNHYFYSFCYSEFSRKCMIWGLSLRLRGNLFIYKQNAFILSHIGFKDPAQRPPGN